MSTTSAATVQPCHRKQYVAAPAGYATNEHLCRTILAQLTPARRRSGGDRGHDVAAEVAAVQLPRIGWFVQRRLPLQMVLPAFPAKSPSTRKVMGVLPDLAERTAIDFLQACCARIAAHYPPGVVLTLCSDGHVFGDAIGHSDDVIEAYRAALAGIMIEQRADHLRLFGLGDWPGCAPPTAPDHARLREHLLRVHGLPVEQVRARLLQSSDGRRQLVAMTRFMLEDDYDAHVSRSRSAAKRIAKRQALAVLQRSWAWGALLAELFPEAVRLSIHPQSAGAIKFGIHLSEERNAWMTPWHGVLLKDGNRSHMVRRHQAEALGAVPVAIGTTHAHFVLPATRLLATRAQGCAS